MEELRKTTNYIQQDREIETGYLCGGTGHKASIDMEETRNAHIKVGE